MQRHTMTEIKPQQKHRLGTVSKILLAGRGGGGGGVGERGERGAVGGSGGGWESLNRFI